METFNKRLLTDLNVDRTVFVVKSKFLTKKKEKKKKGGSCITLRTILDDRYDLQLVSTLGLCIAGLPRKDARYHQIGTGCPHLRWSAALKDEGIGRAACRRALETEERGTAERISVVRIREFQREKMYTYFSLRPDLWLLPRGRY